MTLQFVLRVVEQHAANPSMLLPELMLCDLVTKASFGMSPRQLSDRIDDVMEKEEVRIAANSEHDRHDHFERHHAVSSGSSLLWHDMAKALLSAPLLSDRHRKSGDLLADDECGFAPPAVVAMLMREHVSLQALRDAMQTLAQLYERSCHGVEHGIIAFDELYALAQPLWSSQRRSSPATVLELLPLIELVRIKPHIMMRNQKHSDQYSVYVDAFSQWLSLNPAIQRYLDPACVLIQPSVAPALPNMPGIIAALPPLFPSA
jgi:hypothetical protein